MRGVRLVAPDEGGVGRDRRRPAHAVDEQDRAEREADDDGLGEVAEDGQEECSAENRRLAPARAQQDRNGRLLDHVPCHDGKHARERGKRDVGGKGCRDEHEQENEDGMQHPRDRSMRTRTHVGRGPGDGPCHAEAAEERRADIGHALRDKLAVRTVPPSGHAVGDDRR